MAAAEARRGGAMGAGQEELVNLGERIEVDFDYGANPRVNPDPLEPADPGGRGGRYRGGNGRRGAVMHRRLSTILRNLIHSEDFRISDQLIAMPEGEFRVRNFFVPFSDVQEEHEDQYRGYWGIIADAALSRDDPPSLWLNTGGRDNVSIVVGDEQSDDFLARFPFEDTEELAGAYVLVFGELQLSRNGKLYIRAHDISRFTLSFPDNP
ncbi:hypothetical protein [Pseudomonas putida]|uniref:Uncharacterized protein n=1 Tax=Pseudomonas putida TaxID=303 RepID=A0A6I7ERL5_PSEPU|nr:hypothetical protein [Pseudomonas putida]QHW08396.1 hypothetical protein C2H86_28545 [Pseudomonas putida]